MSGRSTIIAAAMCLSSAAQAQAVQAIDSAAAFGAREAINHANLSPDGNKVVFVGPKASSGSAVYVFDIRSGTPPHPIMSASGDPEKIRACSWITNDRLVCTMVGKLARGQTLVQFSRLIAVDSDGKNVVQLSSRKGESPPLWGGRIIDRLSAGGDEVLIERTLGWGAGNKVEKVNVRTLESKIVESPRHLSYDYISDGLGTVRIMGMRKEGIDYQNTGLTNYFFRRKGRSEWQPMGVFDQYRSEGFVPYVIDPAKDVAYGFGKVEGRLALVSRSLDIDESFKVVASRRDFDVDTILLIGPHGRVVGASFAAERRESIYFDKELAAIAARLGKALPLTPLIEFVDSSADESALLIWAGSDTNPGQYYRFDKIAKTLSPLVPVRPQLNSLNLASVKAITYSAADGTLIPAYLTLPPGDQHQKLPTVVIPHSGSGSRDEWGFNWTVQFFANRGFAVLQPNFRGSFGYGDAWFLKSGFRAWDVAIPDIIDGGKWLIREGIADPDRVFAFGFGFGGYAALQSAVIEPNFFKAVVAVGPATDLEKFRVQVRNYNMDNVAEDFLGSADHASAGSPLRNAGKIAVPVMLFHGALDTNFRVEHSRDLASKLRGAGKPVTFVEYPKLDQSLDDAAARTELLSKSLELFSRRAK